MGDIGNIKLVTTPILIGGETRQLCFTFDGFGYLAERHGGVFPALEKMQKIDMKIFSKASIDLLVDFIYAGLCWNDDTITPKKVARSISLTNMQYIFETIVKAVNQSLPQNADPMKPVEPGKN